MPAANRYGYREGRTERPERRIEEMKRKTFVKQLMALGVSRNEANSMCRDALSHRDYVNTHGGRAYTAWEEALARTWLACSVNIHPAGRQLTLEEQWKFCVLSRKRSKANPAVKWMKEHPDGLWEV